MDKRKRISLIVSAGLATALLIFFSVLEQGAQEEGGGCSLSYFSASGVVFGTYYNIQYEAQKELKDSILATFNAFDRSLSMFNPESVISAINHNRDTLTDRYFEQMWREAERVHAESRGAFDITVAPLVNLWGFGFKNREQVTAAKVDSILPLVGFGKVSLHGHRVHKADARMMLDASAVAKGQACDAVAEMLAANGCANYLVDIGGEVVAKGVNKRGEAWRIGITKPEDDPTGESKALQKVLSTNDIHMATSGNYRNFYYEGSERRSHTIDPRTGYPVQHSLLSATVVASSCMRADALATACMVLGAEEGLRMIEETEDASCYLIAGVADSSIVLTSANWAYPN